MLYVKLRTRLGADEIRAAMQNEPRTPLGRRLRTIRQRAIRNGMPLLTQDQVLEEVARRRAGRSRHWRWQKVLVNLLEVIGILLILLMIAAIAIAILGSAIDHELDRMPTGGHRPTAESGAAVVEDEPQTMTMTATAYSWGCGNGDGYTATMTPVREGVIAVDPEVIPLGTQVEIVGLGMFSAEDRGGLIKGNRVDIFMPSRGEALEYGRQMVEVRVIAD